jgi:hypothetical protein
MAWTTTPYEPREKSRVESAIEWYFRKEIHSFTKDIKRVAFIIKFQDGSVEHIPESKLGDIIANFNREMATYSHAARGGLSGTAYHYAQIVSSTTYGLKGFDPVLTQPFYSASPVNQETHTLTAEEKKQKNKYSNPRL